MKRTLLFALRQRADGRYEAVTRLPAPNQDKFIRIKVPEELLPKLMRQLVLAVSTVVIVPIIDNLPGSTNPDGPGRHQRKEP